MELLHSGDNNNNAVVGLFGIAFVFAYERWAQLKHYEHSMYTWSMDEYIHVV